MIFLEAIMLMNKGHRVKRKRWLKDDFIYMKRGVLYCDGEYPYLDYLTLKEYRAKDWIIYKEGL